jgi:hypothetical protein
MTCCGFGDTADQHFNSKKVEKELRTYRRHGPGVTTRKLRDGLIAAGLTRGTVLDVGGGLGALSLALLDAGMEHARVVDASSAYLAAASAEAARRERSSFIQFVHGDFLTVHATLALPPSSPWTASSAAIPRTDRLWSNRSNARNAALHSRIQGIAGMSDSGSGGRTPRGGDEGIRFARLCIRQRICSG